MQPQIPVHPLLIEAAVEYRRKVAAGEIQPIVHQPSVRSTKKRQRSRRPLIEAMQLGA